MGTAETTTPLPDYFTPVQPHLKVFRRQGGRMLVPPDRVSTSKPAPPIMREFSLLPTTTLPAWLAAARIRAGVRNSAGNSEWTTILGGRTQCLANRSLTYLWRRGRRQEL